MASDVPAGILVKSTAPVPKARFGISGAVSATRVFQSIPPTTTDAFGAAGGAPATWTRIALDGDRDPGSLWDLAHKAVREGFSLSGGGVVTAEPDIPQRWTFATTGEHAFAAAAPCGQPKKPSSFPPSSPENRDWFREPGHSNFGPAGHTNPAGPACRIAHLDTGYDKAHSTVPRNIRGDLERNFVDRAFPNDATDRANGLGTNLGHGTATLAILASEAYGGAPEAEVVPLRVADSVVLFSNSTIAAALDEVYRLTVDNVAPIDVVTMSMGGLASQLWADAVNALYDQGVFMVTAAGNNYGNLPTRFTVYPARFDRVVAACGVMQNHQAYADLAIRIMAGNYGPTQKLPTAMAAPTPNLPWARINCSDTIDWTGGGTSSATPQIAAAAARWIARNRAALDAYPQRWMRIEATRKALFESVRANPDRKRLGHGELDVRAALSKRPAAAASLIKTDQDKASFAFLRVLTGLGVAAGSEGRSQMLEMEALQLSQRTVIEETIEAWDVTPETMSAEQRRTLADMLASQPEASGALKAALGAGDTRTLHRVALPPPSPGADVMAQYHLRQAIDPQPPEPRRRRLRAYAYDPVLSGRMDGWGINEAALDVRWETLRPGPVGEYLEVIDIDPASDCAYAPINLDDPRLVAADGLSPNEADPQFHQQMTYAVAMRTIEHFERALGRVAMWAPSFSKPGHKIEEAAFVQRLRIYPHALRDENAYYSPDRSALLFGYFDARSADTGEVLPGGTVFSCLSHDIVAHETTHALLDGLHLHYREASGPDAFAFHEAFADIVALFQHFNVPEALKAEVAKTRGDLGDENLLAQLAVEFGQSTGRYGALRDAIGGPDAEGRWRRREPKPSDYADATEAHDRGAILVAAVFDAFLAVYRARSADLIRLATGGAGVLPAGAIPVDLVNRLAQEAARIAGEILQMCIRALDYCPPVDITFSDYLRALVTADQDVAPIERRDYRVALIAAFRARGIFPKGVKQLSVTSVAWEAPPIQLPELEDALRRLDEAPAAKTGQRSGFSSRWSLATDRAEVWKRSREAAAKLRSSLTRLPPEELAALGLENVGKGATRTLGDRAGRLEQFVVHSVRPARRIASDGQARTDLVIEVTQTFHPTGGGVVRGGCTLLFDLDGGSVRYLVRKRLGSPGFVGGQLQFRAAYDETSLRDAYFDASEGHGEPFAVLHRHP